MRYNFFQMNLDSQNSSNCSSSQDKLAKHAMQPINSNLRPESFSSNFCTIQVSANYFESQGYSHLQSEPASYDYYGDGALLPKYEQPVYWHQVYRLEADPAYHEHGTVDEILDQIEQYSSVPLSPHADPSSCFNQTLSAQNEAEQKVSASVSEKSNKMTEGQISTDQPELAPQETSKLQTPCRENAHTPIKPIFKITRKCRMPPYFKKSFDPLKLFKIERVGKPRYCSAKQIQIRTRLTEAQLAILELEFAKLPAWDFNVTQALAKRLGIDRLKIYKWHYDKSKHINTSPLLRV